MEKYQSKKWILPEPAPEAVLTAFGDFPLPVRQILFSRGFPDPLSANRFLKGGDPLGDPFLLKGMATATERIHGAISQNEKIAVYGDYDVDGVTATALLVEAFQSLGGQAQGYIPDRFDEGYGLNNDALDSLAAQGVKVVVTVDCGIRSPREAQHAREIGVDLIIIDHHHPKGDVPECAAVICPKQAGDEYPYKDLAGVGLAYKLAQGLFLRSKESVEFADRWLEFVALGTVADVVPLTGENRSLVRAGLQALRSTTRVGLIALANMAGIRLPEVTSMNIGFGLAPRLNAAGRIQNARDAFLLLLSQDKKEAVDLASVLERQNRERQEQTKNIQQSAEAMIQKEGDGYLLFADSSGFNPGVVGLAASKLVESYYLPAIVAFHDTETTRGSCRSISEFHITDALDEVAELLVQHGGHAMAAGFTVRNEKLDEFKQRIKEIARRELAGKELAPRIHVDAEIRLRDLKPELLPYLDDFQPVGQENPEVVFLSRNLEIRQKRTVGADQDHLKLILSDGYITFDAIGFRMARHLEWMQTHVDAVYNFGRNTFNGNTTLQLNIRDLKPSDTHDK